MAHTSQTAGGHKANLDDPNTSAESKQHSKQVLENELNDENDESESKSSHEKNPNNVVGGLKATLKNPNVSDEAKRSAQERLESMEQ